MNWWHGISLWLVCHWHAFNSSTGKVSANVHWLSRLVFVTWIRMLGKRDVIAESSCGISFSKIKKERKNHRKSMETQDHFFRCTVGRSQKLIRVRHRARRYAFVRTWRADGGCLYERKLYVLHARGNVRSKTRSLRCLSSTVVYICRALEFVLLQY